MPLSTVCRGLGAGDVRVSWGYPAPRMGATSYCLVRKAPYDFPMESDDAPGSDRRTLLTRAAAAGAIALTAPVVITRPAFADVGSVVAPSPCAGFDGVVGSVFPGAENFDVRACCGGEVIVFALLPVAGPSFANQRLFFVDDDGNVGPEIIGNVDNDRDLKEFIFVASCSPGLSDTTVKLRFVNSDASPSPAVVSWFAGSVP